MTIPAATPVGTPFDAAVLDGPSSGKATLEGKVPEWLRGRLMRTAPAVFELGGWSAAHWFDGLGMLYALDIEPAEVRFKQRLVDCEAVGLARRGRMPVSSFATRNDRSFLERIFQPIAKLTDNTNVNIVPTPNGWLAMTETPRQLLIDGDSLETSRAVHYEDVLGAGVIMLAHPVHERATDELINLAIGIGRKVTITPYRQKLGAFVREPIGTIVMGDLPYLHAFGVTPTKIVVVAPPLRANPLKLLWSNAGYIDHFRWHATRPTDIYLVDRSTGDVRHLEADPFFFFHTVNAFDDGDDVVIDLCASRDASIIDRLRIASLRDDPSTDSTLCRLRIPASGSRATRETLNTEPLEFPSVNHARVGGRRHDVLWGAAIARDATSITSAIRRIGAASGSATRFERERVVYGEPLFVRRPAGTTEDDGVLLAVGSDLVARTAELVILDARDLEPLATARLPIPLPLGFHGSFQRLSAGTP
ncbi:carotenoid oxygenase family protein [soil metagenome]